MIESDDLYKKYIIYLKQKVDNKRLTNSKYKLLLISYNFFHNFKELYERSNFLKEKIDNIYFQEIRDEKLEIILKYEKE
jgi:hypothetical protein